MVAGASGIGYYITSMQYAGHCADMYPALLPVGLCGYAINRVFVQVEGRVLFWHRSGS